MSRLLFPQEVEVWYVIPSIRRELALEMSKLGMSQSRIAEILGITPAAISQYKSQKRAAKEVFNEHLRNEIKLSAKTVKEDKTKMFNEIMRINNLVKKEGLLCKLHKSLGKTPECCEGTCESLYFDFNEIKNSGGKNAGI